MRTTKLTALTLTMLLVACSVARPVNTDVHASFGVHYSELSPHGNWLISASYGRVWQPSVYAAGWNPYYDGHWVYSDCGWTWVSDYSWGAIPYHYGTWVVDASFGWVWVPGDIWAPSWVVFRTGPDYIGWAPVPVDYAVGVTVGLTVADPNLFVFVGTRDFLAPRVRTYAVPVATTRTIINTTTVVTNINIENNVVVNRGPDVAVIERATGARVTPIPVERVKRIAPSQAGRVTREALRVDTVQAQRGLRAAAPVAQDEPLPGRDRGRRASSQSANDERGPHRDAPPSRPADQFDSQSNAQTREGVNPDAQARQRMEAENRARADAQARQRMEAESRARADDMAREQKRVEAQARADARAKAKAEAKEKEKAQQDSKNKNKDKKKKKEKSEQRPPTEAPSE